MSKLIDNYCQDCGIRILKTGKIRPKRCKECYNKILKSKSGENSPFYDATLRICKVCGGPKTPRSNRAICKKCYDESMSNKNRCKKCGAKRARNTSEYCQQCYRGPVTKKWNPDLTEEFRKNGRSANPAYYAWRLEVFERDKFQCQKCGDCKGGNLVAHHIFPFKSHPLLRTELSNGITLCEKCHIAFHKKYGWGDNNQIQINEYLNIGK